MATSTLRAPSSGIDDDEVERRRLPPPPPPMSSVLLTMLQSRDLSSARKLFLLPDDEIGELSGPLCEIESIIRSEAYLHNRDEQNLVEISVMRLNSLVRESGCIEHVSVQLTRILNACVANAIHNPHSPHAKVASDLINCIFLSNDRRRVMETAVPVGVKFLMRDGSLLARNMTSYLGLAAVHHADIVARFAHQLVDSLTRGNYPILRLMPQIYPFNAQKINARLPAIVRTVTKCSKFEKDCLLALLSNAIVGLSNDLAYETTTSLLHQLGAAPPGLAKELLPEIRSFATAYPIVEQLIIDIDKLPQLDIYLEARQLLCTDHYGDCEPPGATAMRCMRHLPETTSIVGQLKRRGKSSFDIAPAAAAAAAAQMAAHRAQSYSAMPMSRVTHAHTDVAFGIQSGAGSSAAWRSESGQSIPQNHHSRLSLSSSVAGEAAAARHAQRRGSRHSLGTARSREVIQPGIPLDRARTATDGPYRICRNGCDGVHIHNETNGNDALNHSHESADTNANNNATLQRPQVQLISSQPVQDAMQQFCERNLQGIKRYMNAIFVKYPLPQKCVIEERKSKKYCKLCFGCQERSPICLYNNNRFFLMKTRLADTWLHLMFLALQAKSAHALSQQDAAIHSLKMTFEHVSGHPSKSSTPTSTPSAADDHANNASSNSASAERAFASLVTSAFPNYRQQEALLIELKRARYYDLFQYNALTQRWSCFLCSDPQSVAALLRQDPPILSGELKELRSPTRWAISLLQYWEG